MTRGTERECALGPSVGCHRPIRPHRARLAIVQSGDTSDNRLSWNWRPGEETVAADFGDPRGATDYALCLYDETDDLLTGTRIPAGRTCGNKPCWKQGRSSGRLRYLDRERAPDGLERLRLHPGASGRASISATGQGPNLMLPVLPRPEPIRLIVQLQATNGECWEASYSAAGVRHNDARKLQAVAD